MTELTQLFCDLVAIPSPSGQEKAVIDFINNELTAADIQTYTDSSADQNDSDTGNLIAVLPGSQNKPSLLFTAHVDTVEDGSLSINPKISRGLVTSVGDTILGADNKASVAALVCALKRLNSSPDKPTIYAAFTTREEKGRMGSSLLKVDAKIDMAFNLDGSSPLGTFVNRSLGEVPFKIVLLGKAAHAATNPELGINALKAAAQLIMELELGRDETGRVINIGAISGGKGNNVVPDEINLSGQLRAFESNKLKSMQDELKTKVEAICKETGCKASLDFTEEEGAPPVNIDKSSSICHLAQKAATKLNLPFELSDGYFTSDASYISAYCPTLTVGRGSTNPHGYNEEMSVDNLHLLEKMVLAIAELT